MAPGSHATKARKATGQFAKKTQLKRKTLEDPDSEPELDTSKWSPKLVRALSVAEENRLYMSRSNTHQDKEQRKQRRPKKQNVGNGRQGRAQRSSAVQSSSPVQHVISGQPDFTSQSIIPRPTFMDIPIELRRMILFSASPRDIPRIRRVSRAVNKYIQSDMEIVLEQFRKRDIKHLEDERDEMTMLSPPVDLHSTMRALHVWTKRRGTFVGGWRGCNMTSCFQLSAYLHKFLGDLDSLEDRDEAAPTVFKGAQRAWNVIRACNDPYLADENPKWRAAMIKLFGPSDAETLFAYSRNPETIDPSLRICGPTHLAHEHKTWPVGTLTGLFPYPLRYFAADRRVTVAYDNFIRWLENGSHPDIVQMKPDYENESLFKFLDLPTLPNPMLCYYLSTTWARFQYQILLDKFNKPGRTKGVSVKPLLKAALIEAVAMI